MNWSFLIDEWKMGKLRRLHLALSTWLSHLITGNSKIRKVRYYNLLEILMRSFIIPRGWLIVIIILGWYNKRRYHSITTCTMDLADVSSLTVLYLVLWLYNLVSMVGLQCTGQEKLFINSWSWLRYPKWILSVILQIFYLLYPVYSLGPSHIKRLWLYDRLNLMEVWKDVVPELLLFGVLAL